MRPPKWHKNLGETAKEWEGGSSRRRESTPLEWKIWTGGGEPLGYLPMEKECQGKTYRGGEGTEPPPHHLSNRDARSQHQRRGNDTHPGTVAPPRQQQGTLVDRDIKGTLHSYTNGASGARHKNGMQLRREYGLLAPEELTGDPAAVGTQVRGYGHEATRGTDDQGQRATDT